MYTQIKQFNLHLGHDPFDYTLMPLYFFLLSIFGIIYSCKYKHKRVQFHFLLGYILKLFGALFMGFYVKFYYKGGDSFYLYMGSKSITEKFFTNFNETLNIIFSSATKIIENNKLGYFEYVYGIIIRESSFLMVKVGGIFGVLGFNNFLTICLLFGVLGFIGNWKLYKSFVILFPNINNKIACACLFLPSNIIIGSGFLKETLAIFLTGSVFLNIIKILELGKSPVRNLLSVGIFIYFLFVLKSYIALSIIISTIILMVLKPLLHIHSLSKRIIITLILVVVGIAISFFCYKIISTTNSYYNLRSIAVHANFFQNNYELLDPSGEKTFDIGSIEVSETGLLKKAPIAVFSTLFRPFPWEAHNLLSFLVSFENIFLFIITIMVILQCKIKNFIFIFFNNPYIAFCCIMTLSLSFIIGVTTFNFGTLIRYRLPLIPFYLVALGFCYNYHKLK